MPGTFAGHIVHGDNTRMMEVRHMPGLRKQLAEFAFSQHAPHFGYLDGYLALQFSVEGPPDLPMPSLTQ